MGIGLAGTVPAGTVPTGTGPAGTGLVDTSPAGTDLAAKLRVFPVHSTTTSPSVYLLSQDFLHFCFIFSHYMLAACSIHNPFLI